MFLWVRSLNGSSTRYIYTVQDREVTLSAIVNTAQEGDRRRFLLVLELLFRGF